jgi:hypothetical protein
VNRRALPSILFLSLVLLNLCATARYCVGYQTNPEIGIDAIGVLDRPRWDAHIPRHRPDEVWFWLATGNENGVSGDTLYFFLVDTGFWCFLASTGLALVAFLARAPRSLV